MGQSTLHVRGLNAIDVAVLDLSQTGFRIAADTDLAVGEEISVGLSGAEARRAYVAWHREGLIGCAFEKPLPDEEVAQVLTSASVVRIGTPIQAAEIAASSGQAKPQDLYGEHSL